MTQVKVMEKLGLKIGFIARHRYLDFTAITKKLLSDDDDKKAYVYALESTVKTLDVIWLSYVAKYCENTTVPKEWAKGLSPQSYRLSNRELIY